jgi:hypothetical protein
MAYMLAHPGFQNPSHNHGGVGVFSWLTENTNHFGFRWPQLGYVLGQGVMLGCLQSHDGFRPAEDSIAEGSTAKPRAGPASTQRPPRAAYAAKHRGSPAPEARKLFSVRGTRIAIGLGMRLWCAIPDVASAGCEMIVSAVASSLRATVREDADVDAA